MVYYEYFLITTFKGICSFCFNPTLKYLTFETNVSFNPIIHFPKIKLVYICVGGCFKLKVFVTLLLQ